MVLLGAANLGTCRGVFLFNLDYSVQRHGKQAVAILVS